MTSTTHANNTSSPKSTTNTVTNQTFESSTKPSTEAPTTETPTDTTTDSPTEPPTVLSTEPPATEPPPIDPTTKPPPTEPTANPHFQLQLKKHGQVIIPHFEPPEKLNKWKTVDRDWDSLTIEIDHTKLNLGQYSEFSLKTDVEAVVEAFETSVVNIIINLPRYFMLRHFT